MISHKRFSIGLISLLFLSLLLVSSSTVQAQTPPPTTIPNFDCYRNASSLTAKMQLLAETHSNLSEFETIGASFDGAPIYVLEIGNEANVGKPHFILLAGLHGNDFSQPELGLQLAEKLLEGYGTDADLQWIVDNVELDLILLANPDGRLGAEAQALTYSDPEDISFTTNKHNVDLEKNFCFPTLDSTVDCSNFAFEPETQAIINYLETKFGEPTPDQSPQEDSQNLFIYFSSHNKEISSPDMFSKFQGKLRIPKFYTTNLPGLTDPSLLRIKELTEMLRIFDPDPKYNIETFKTEGLLFEKYPVDYLYFSYGIASVELSAPPAKESIPMGCDLFTSEHVKNYTNLLMNAAKAAAQPYKIGYGPIVDELTKTELTAVEVKFHATISEKNQIPNQPERNPITSVHYHIDQPTGTDTEQLHGWVEIDDNPYTSAIDFAIPIKDLDMGKHVLTLQACSQDEVNNPNGECGRPLSAFLEVTDPDDTPDPGDPDPPGPVGNIIYLPLIRR